MRILIVAGSYPPEECGIGDYTENLASSLAQLEDVQVGILTSYVESRKSKGPVELVEVVKHWFFSELPRLVFLIRCWRPDILHIQYPSQGFLGVRMPSVLPLVCRLIGIKVVETWHEIHLSKGVFHFLFQALGTNGLVFVRPNYLAKLPRFFRWFIRKTPQITISNTSALPMSRLNEDQRLKERAKYIGSRKRLIVFFGFLYPNKGVESIFEIANSDSDYLVIAGTTKDQEYLNFLNMASRKNGWTEDSLNFSGFLSRQGAADLLAAADAVILPYVEGGGDWNTAIHSARTQGTFVITTDIKPRGYESNLNMYTASPLDINSMRIALDQFAGYRNQSHSPTVYWHQIALSHLNFYRQITGK